MTFYIIRLGDTNCNSAIKWPIFSEKPNHFLIDIFRIGSILSINRTLYLALKDFLHRYNFVETVFHKKANLSIDQSGRNVQLFQI